MYLIKDCYPKYAKKLLKQHSEKNNPILKMEKTPEQTFHQRGYTNDN